MGLKKRSSELLHYASLSSGPLHSQHRVIEYYQFDSFRIPCYSFANLLKGFTVAVKCPQCDTDNPSDSKYCKECAAPLPSPGEAVVTETLETPKEELTTGSTFAGRYQIIEELGKGGMGWVYRAVDKKLNEEVALKLIKPEIVSDMKTLERFSNELKIARKIAHKNVGRMYELMEEKGTHFITMEYVPGEDLKSFIRRSGQLAVGTTIRIAKQVCEGLTEAHRIGVIHRDLKPSNIMIDKEGNARIMDFGIARSMKASGITGSGVMIGTAEYMSPEQAEAKDVNQSSDIYSLGVILFEMVTGQLLFQGETPLVIAMKHKSETPKDPIELNPNIPEDLSRLILKCLEKNREKRYQEAKELFSELEKVEKRIITEERILPERRPEVKRKIKWKNPILYSSVALFLIALIVACGYFLFIRKKPIDSIAVLPFENINADPESEYLSDGITGTLIHKLSQLPQLKKVISSHSVFAYKGQTIDPKKVGQELDVKVALLSRMIKSGNEISFNIELINTRDNSHLWSEKYTQNIEKIFDVEEKMATDIAQALQLNLKKEETQPLTERHTDNTEAYKFYLKAVYSMGKATEEGLQKSFDYLHQALEEDPTYAFAYSGLAGLYSMLGYYKLLAPQDAYPRAKAAAVKALELDDNLAEAHGSLAIVKLFYEWDWTSAEEEIKRAIALNPNLADAHADYSYYYNLMGRREDSIAEITRALELNPLSEWMNVYYSFILMLARQYDQAIEHLQKVLKIYPNNFNLHGNIGWNYSLKGMHDEAIRETEKAVELSGDNPVMIGRLGRVLAVAGRREEAMKILNKMLEQSKEKKNYVSPYYIAIIYLKLGQKDKAFEWLEKAYEARDDMIIHLRADPDFDPISSDPRYQALLKKMNLD